MEQRGLGRSGLEVSVLGLGCDNTGDDVWIGANAVILPGTEVATGTIVSASAVVIQNTEPYSIVAGVPARMIARRRPRATATGEDT